METKFHRAFALSLAVLGMIGCGDDPMSDLDDPDDRFEPMEPSEPEPPAFQEVEVVLETWEFYWSDANIEIAFTDLELQIGWNFAYAVRNDPSEPGLLESDSGVIQIDDVKNIGNQGTVQPLKRSLARYREYCDDPSPRIFLTLLEVDEGFDRTGTETRAALGALAVAVGLVAPPVTAAVFGSILVLEGLFAKNDDVGTGEFVIEDGSNRLRLTGKNTRSTVAVRKDVLSGTCPE